MIIQVKVKTLGGNCKYYQHTAPPMNQKQAQHRHDHNDAAPFPLFLYRNDIFFLKSKQLCTDVHSKAELLKSFS